MSREKRAGFSKFIERAEEWEEGWGSGVKHFPNNVLSSDQGHAQIFQQHWPDGELVTASPNV